MNTLKMSCSVTILTGRKWQCLLSYPALNVASGHNPGKQCQIQTMISVTCSPPSSTLTLHPETRDDLMLLQPALVTDSSFLSIISPFHFTQPPLHFQTISSKCHWGGFDTTKQWIETWRMRVPIYPPTIKLSSASLTTARHTKSLKYLSARCGK